VAEYGIKIENSGLGFRLGSENSMMRHSLKVALICGMFYSSSLAVRAQGVIPDGEDADLIATPYNTGVNGVTDRYGMPIGASFIGPPWIRDQPIPTIEAERPTAAATKRVAPGRTKSALKRSLVKTKVGNRTQELSKSRSALVPRYFLPHGSLRWSPGPGSIDTSPANPYGYGYGISGYGTEVFGDFWKGWPIVQY
jgi:hypothetical protein